MKKILSAVLALIMVFCLAACNGGTPANGDGNVNGDNSANADFKIGVILVGDETEATPSHTWTASRPLPRLSVSTTIR